MASLYTKVQLYLKDNSKTWDDTKVSLQNVLDERGDFIASWSYDIDKPTAEQLASYETAGNTEESNNKVRSTRKAAYGDIGEQLDEIYKDIDAWKERIKKIKDDNPKE
jgi:hypothetical protein|tara:strand:- start:10 stop:333 length:324 start_codon:yes stop_codon:yes gene_type:complete